MMFFQYLPEEWSPIEGFYIFYKVYNDPNAFHKIPILGASHREYVLIDLQPNTLYDIHMVCFNLAGQSERSNTVVEKTIGE